MIVLFTALALAEPTSNLEAAYQKEYAYLRAEREELRGRLAELQADAKSRVREAESGLDEAQARLVSRARSADRQEDELDRLEREGASLEDAAILLENTLRQAGENFGLNLPAAPQEALLLVFQTAALRLAAGGSTGWSDGSFFLPGGEQVEGRIFRFGEIAAWGAASRGAGALAPAGEGRLQLRREAGVTTAQALTSGQPPVLDLLLYEPDRGVEEAEKEGGLGQVLEESGTMGQVLFGLGCVSGLLVLIRALTLLFARRGGLPLVNAVVAATAAGRIDTALHIVGKRSFPTSRLLGTVLDGANRIADRGLDPEAGRAELDRVVDEAILRETPGIDRFASALVVITAGAPLMGLLGTVTGMIATFDVITEHGTGNPKLMSAGIAEALICTALGLAVAIPTLLAGNVLTSLADSVKLTLDRGALMLLNALEEAPLRRPARAASLPNEAPNAARSGEDASPLGEQAGLSGSP